MSWEELSDTIWPHGQKSVHCRYWFQLNLLQKFWPICLFSTNTFRIFPPGHCHEDCDSISAPILLKNCYTRQKSALLCCQLQQNHASKFWRARLSSTSLEHEQLRPRRIQLTRRNVHKSSICKTELVMHVGREYLKEENGIRLQNNTSDFK